jgi:hypothetical protein
MALRECTIPEGNRFVGSGPEDRLLLHAPLQSVQPTLDAV